MKDKLFIVADFMPGSGVTTFIDNTFLNDVFSEIEITGVCISEDERLTQKYVNFGWHMLNIPAANRNLLNHLKHWTHLIKMGTFDNSTVYFNYSASWNFLPIVFLKKRKNIRVVIHGHNTYFGTSGSRVVETILEKVHRVGQRILFRDADVKLAVSEQSAKWIFGRAQTSDISIVKNGINVTQNRFSPEERNCIRSEGLGVNSNSTVLMNVGRLEDRKNQMFLIDLMRSLRNNEDYVLWLFGEGPLRKALELKIIEYQLSDCVKLFGRKDNLNPYYSAADIFVQPSLNEGLSMAYLEAQAHGNLILTSDKVPLGDYSKKQVYSSRLEVNEWRQIIAEFKQSKIDRSKSWFDLKNRGYDSNATANTIYTILFSSRG